MNVSPIFATTLALVCLSLPACQPHKEGGEHQEHHTIVATSPLAKNVTVTQQYVCQIRAQNYIEVCALQVDGYLKEPLVKEGQTVKEGEVMFEILPVLYQRKLDAERAEARFAQIKYDTTKQLNEQTPPVVSPREVAMAQAELDKINAKVKSAEAELNFATIRAPFSGIVDRQFKQKGSLVEKKDVLTTLSDTSVMRAYFNVPEVSYLGDMAGPGVDPQNVDLVLADGSKFPQHCLTVIRTGKFNNETGNLAYRADFPNPSGLLRHGQTGKVVINRNLHDALVIPQRATFEILDRQYVFVIGADHVVRQREIFIQYEMDDIFVIKKGLEAGEKFILEGVRQVRDGEKVEAEFRKPEEAMANMKTHAE